MSTLEVRITSIRALTPVIRELTLAAPDGSRLPAFSAGSHIQVLLDDGQRCLRNAYSLLGDPADRHTYRIAVRRQAQSRGGSAFVHDVLREQTTLRITPPANLFPLYNTCGTHILVAGGIGITPFLAQIAELERRGADFELHYAYRPGLTDAYADVLARRLGARLRRYDGQSARFDAARVLAGRSLGTHVYVCGPASLLGSVQAAACKLGWSSGRVHSEAFVSAAPGKPFTAWLTRSGQRIEVPAEQSLLEALEQAGIEVPNLCRGGACGQCATPHAGDEIEHRDSYLSPAERATHLMPCVSRALGKTLTLDL
jgi:dimethylamine monooxygenase subunit B